MVKSALFVKKLKLKEEIEAKLKSTLEFKSKKY